MNWFKRSQFNDMPVVNIENHNGYYYAVVNGDLLKIKGYMESLNDGSWQIVEKGKILGRYPDKEEAYDNFVKYIEKSLSDVPDISRRRETQLV